VPVVSIETDPYLADITGRGPGWSMRFALVADIGAVRRDQDTVDIVIYEEDSLTRALLHQWLGEAGYRVHIGMPRDTDRDRAADLVIVNVFMPKHAGAQWIRSVQAAHPNTPVIAISGQFRSGLSAAGAAAQTLGVRQVIAKPLVRADLLDAVRGVIGAPD
jgi:DNA-binding response OmpR family regulator